MKRRTFLKHSLLVGGSALITAPAFIGMVNRRNGFWQQQDSGLWSLKQADPIFASTIITRDIGGTDDKRVTMNNSGFARLLPSSLGAWVRVRLGIRFTINGGAQLPAPTGNFAFMCGFNAGTDAIISDGSVTQFVGTFSGSNAATSLAAADASNIASYAPLYWYMRKQAEATSNSLADLSATPIYLPANATIATSRYLFFTVIRGNPNYQFECFYPSSRANTVADASQSGLLNTVINTVPAVTGYTNSTPAAVAFTPAAELTAINIGWTWSAASLEVCDIAIAKFA